MTSDCQRQVRRYLAEGKVQSFAEGELVVKLLEEKWPEEETPDYCEVVIAGGEYGTNKDPFLIFPVIHALTDNTEAARIVTQDGEYST